MHGKNHSYKAPFPRNLEMQAELLFPPRGQR
jgi:hypothetical protein